MTGSMSDDLIAWFGHWTKIPPKCHALLTTGGHNLTLSVVWSWDQQTLVGCDMSDTHCCVYQTRQLLDVTLNSLNRQQRCCFTFQFAFGQKQVSPFLQKKIRAIPVKHARLPPRNTHRYQRGGGGHPPAVAETRCRAEQTKG